MVVNLGAAHLAPVSDPLKTMVWHAGTSDIDAVLVDGRLVVEGGRHLLADEDAIVAGRRGPRCARCGRRAWNGAISGKARSSGRAYPSRTRARHCFLTSHGREKAYHPRLVFCCSADKKKLVDGRPSPTMTNGKTPR